MLLQPQRQIQRTPSLSQTFTELVTDALQLATLGPNAVDCVVVSAYKRLAVLAQLIGTREVILSQKRVNNIEPSAPHTRAGAVLFSESSERMKFRYPLQNT